MTRRATKRCLQKNADLQPLRRQAFILRRNYLTVSGKKGSTSLLSRYMSVSALSGLSVRIRLKTIRCIPNTIRLRNKQQMQLTRQKSKADALLLWARHLREHWRQLLQLIKGKSYLQVVGRRFSFIRAMNSVFWMAF